MGKPVAENRILGAIERNGDCHNPSELEDVFRPCARVPTLEVSDREWSHPDISLTDFHEPRAVSAPLR